MWSPLALILLVGLAAAAPVWKPNTEYEFEVYARTITALPHLRDQYVGMVTRAYLTVQATSANELVGKLSEVQHAHYHDDIPQVHETMIDESKLSYEKSPLKGHTFVLHYKNGYIQDIEVDSTATNDEANQIKALVSQLQVDITGENLMKDKPSFLPPGTRPVGLYNVMEPVVTGECETLYQLSDLPSIIWPTLRPKWAPNTALNTTDNLFSIKKEYNFGNCKDRKGYHFGLTGDGLKPNSNQVGGLMSDVSTSLVIAMGNPKNFTIKYATTSEEVFIRAGLNDDQQAQVVSQIQLALINVHPVQKPIEKPKSPVQAGNLVYRYNLPSDPQNKLRPQRSVSVRGYNAYSEEESYLRRPRRSAMSNMMKHKKDTQGQDSGSSSGESDEHHEQQQHDHDKQPQASMSAAPEIPLNPLFIGHKGSMIQNSEKVTIEENCFELANQIATDVQDQCNIPKKHALDKFSMLSGFLRLMDVQQIKEVGNRVQSALSSQKPGKKQDKPGDDTRAQTAWQVYRDAVVEAGTNAAVRTLFDWVSSGQLAGEEAAQAIAALQKSIRVPTPELAKEFFNFAKSEQVKRDRRVHAAAVVSFTSFLEGVEVDKEHAKNYYPSNSFQIRNKQNEELLLNEVIPYFAKQLEQAVNKKANQDTLLYTRALGNLGHPAILKAFNTQMQNDTNLTEFERVAMVFAMDKLAKNSPKAAHHTLHQIYSNVAENPQVRCAAVLHLLKSNPPAYTVQQMAALTQTDPQTHVQACTKSAILSAADLKLPENYGLAKKCEAAKQHLTPVEFGEHYPEIKFKDYWLENLQASHYRELSVLTSPESYYPNVFDYQAEDNVEGFKSQLFEFNAMLTSVDDLVAFFKGHLGYNQEEQYRQARADPGFASKWTRQYVTDHLNLRPYVDDDMEGHVYMKALGLERYLPFDKKALEQAPEKLAAAIRNAGHLNYHKFHVANPVEVGFPLATGHPLFFKSSMPGLLQIKGKLKVKLSDKKDALLSTVNVTAQGSALYSSTRLAHVGFFVPSISQQYVAGYNKKVQVHLPLNLEVNFSAKEKSVHGRLSFLEPQKDVILAQAGSWPFTARKSIDALVPIAAAEDLKKIHSRPTKGFKFCSGKDTTGSVYCVDAAYEWKYGDLLQYFELLQQQDFGALSKWRLPVGQNDYYNVKLVHAGSKSTAKGVRFAFKVSELYRANQEAQNQPMQDDDVKLSFAQNTSPNSEERRQELAQNAVSGIADARAELYDFSAVFEGSQQAEYGFTFVKVKSTFYPKHRVSFNGFARPVKKEDSKQLCGLAWVNAPQVPSMNFEEALATDLKSRGGFDFVLGPNCLSAPTRYTGRMELNRSDRLKKEVSSSAAAEHCRQEMKHGHDLAPPCVNATYLASFLDHGEVNVHFENPSPKFRNLTNFVHNYLRYKHFGHFEVDHHKTGAKNTMELEVDLNQDRRTVNATLQTPDYREDYKEIPYSRYLHGLFYLQPKVAYSRELGLADHYTCSLANNQVWSFDNSTTQQRFGKCWYAMAHYVDDHTGPHHNHQHSPLDAFSVLVRGHPEGQQKEVLMIFPQPGKGHDHSVRLSPAPGGVIAHALVDGDEHEVGEGSQVVKHDDGKNPLTDKPAFTVLGYKNEVTVYVRDGDVQVKYNDKGVHIVAHKSYFRDVRGLCGNYNGEKYDDKLNPRNCGYESEKYLAPSWSIADEECDQEEQKLRKQAEEAKCNKHYYVHSIFFPVGANSPAHGLDSSSSSSESSSSESYEHGQNTGYEGQQVRPRAAHTCNPRSQIQFIQSANQICFSKEELNACPQHCMPVEKTAQRVPVHCRDINDPLAQHYKRHIKEGARIDMSGKATTKVLTFSVPGKCHLA